MTVKYTLLLPWFDVDTAGVPGNFWEDCLISPIKLRYCHDNVVQLKI